MVWFFERNGETIGIETHSFPDTSEYFLITKRSDGQHGTERFTDSASFRARLDELERQLRSEAWVPNGEPMSLLDAWRL